MGAAAAAEAKPAATLVLVRDAPLGLEVLMVERHQEMDFAKGATVFPGGKLAPGEADARVCAIRETFEECAVFLARQAGEPAFIDAERAAVLGRRWRARLAAQPGELQTLLREERLDLACDALVPFAHWVTPEFSPRRFDTHFFIAAAPAGQAPLHDGCESVAAVWLRPAEALREAAARQRKIMFPTLANLSLLAQSTDVHQALAAARARHIVTVAPRMERRGDGKVFARLPEGTGYPPLAPELLELNVH